MRNNVLIASGLALLAASSCARLDGLWNTASSSDHNAPDAPSQPVGLTDDAGMPGADDASAPPSDPSVARVDDASAPPADGATAAIIADASSDAGALNAASGDASADAVVDTRPTITALALRTGIVEAPNGNARWIGYVRSGGQVAILRGPVGNDGCPARRDVQGAGWWQVEGGGYVCVGYLAALTPTLEGRNARRLNAQADLDAAMPFLYGITTRPAAMYRWAPSTDDERAVEPERFIERPRTPAPAPAASTDASVEGADATAVAAPSGDAGAPADADSGVRIEELEGAPDSPLLRRMLGRMYVSLDREVRAGSGGSYWHTQSGGYVRTGAISTLRTGATFQGVRLEGPTHLPAAFAISAVTPTYTQVGTAMHASGRAPRLTFFQLTGDPPVRIGADEYHRTADGLFVRSRNVRLVTVHEPPADLAPNEKWVDVNLDHQALVAYEGTTPVYVTLVSTGLRRRGSATDNYETIQGAFRIQSKHVATTMDGNSNDGPYSIEDVPWVMYFEQSFALHGAFWHNGFGLMHSHGCVNLSPPDARWVFGWSEPRLPAGWHGAYATAQTPGTRVYVHYDEQALGERGGPAHVPTH
ncbi:MAG: L,D-transpeptidase [Polyangiales bacterium]